MLLSLLFSLSLLSYKPIHYCIYMNQIEYKLLSYNYNKRISYHYNNRESFVNLPCHAMQYHTVSVNYITCKLHLVLFYQNYDVVVVGCCSKSIDQSRYYFFLSLLISIGQVICSLLLLGPIEYNMTPRCCNIYTIRCCSCIILIVIFHSFYYYLIMNLREKRFILWEELHVH